MVTSKGLGYRSPRAGPIRPKNERRIRNEIVPKGSMKRYADTYVIRIYRRKGQGGQDLAGVVEEIGVPGRKAFSGIDELWDLLTTAKRKGREEGKFSEERNGRFLRVVSDQETGRRSDTEGGEE
jgi:hypothetical protein